MHSVFGVSVAACSRHGLASRGLVPKAPSPHVSRMGANPTIERTSLSWLRQPMAAAHVKS